MAYVYQHIRLDTNEIFYVGISKGKKYNRAYLKVRRNSYWTNIINKTQYKIEIIKDNISWEEACVIEKELITKYGRKDNNTGILANMTDGGEGKVNVIYTEEQKEKLKNQFKNLERTDSWKNNIKLVKTGSKHSEETKKKISQSNKGKHTNNHLKESAIKRRKFTDDEILFIRESVKNKTKTRKELMLKFNLTEQRMCDIIKGRVYKHLPI